jgi:hypothetical protein
MPALARWFPPRMDDTDHPDHPPPGSLGEHLRSLERLKRAGIVEHYSVDPVISRVSVALSADAIELTRAGRPPVLDPELMELVARGAPAEEIREWLRGAADEVRRSRGKRPRDRRR